MKNRVSLILLLLFFVISCRTGEKKDDTKVEKPVLQEYFFPEELTYYQNITDIIPDKFYPIGWSHDGNFAYIEEPADEALGNYQMRIVIMSLVSNEVFWSWETDPGTNEELYREDVWHQRYDLFKKMLNKYGIIQQKKYKIQGSYFTYKGKDFTVYLKIKTKKDPDLDIDLVNSSQVWIKSPQLGEKMIIEKNYESSIIIGQQIVGVLLSPYEDRIAIILKNERMGYEGPPNIVEFQLVGTNLTTGFKRNIN